MNEHDLQPLLDVRQNQLGLVFSESDSIETKALAIIGAGVGVLIFAEQASLHIGHWWMGLLMVGGYIFALLLSVAVIWRWPYAGAGVNLLNQPEYLEMDKDSLVLQLMADTDQAIATNQRLNQVRWRLAMLSFSCSSVATLTLFVII
jgi:hypothetical protein